MKMSVSTMTVETMIVNICDSETAPLGQIIPSGDYYVVVESNNTLAMAVDLSQTKVELFTYISGADDLEWAFQGDGSANTRFRISNYEADKFMSYDDDEVVLVSENTTQWNMVLESVDGNDYLVYIRLVSDPTRYIGVETVETEAQCMLYPRTQALQFRLIRKSA